MNSDFETWDHKPTLYLDGLLFNRTKREDLKTWKDKLDVADKLDYVGPLAEHGNTVGCPYAVLEYVLKFNFFRSIFDKVKNPGTRPGVPKIVFCK